MKPIVTSPHNPLVQHFVRLKEERRYRHSSGSFLVEGSKMVAEAQERLPVKHVLAIREGLIPPGVPGHLVTPALMKKISSQVSPEGVVAEVAFSPQGALKNERFLLVLDRLQDPGNVGTLIRTAVAFGWEAIVVLEPCADPFNAKALRAAKGATFRIPIVSMTPQQLADYCKNIPLVAADISGKPFTKMGPCALILGNEGQGLSEDIKALQPQLLTIALQGDMESLNVAAAGAILLHGLR